MPSGGGGCLDASPPQPSAAEVAGEVDALFARFAEAKGAATDEQRPGGMDLDAAAEAAEGMAASGEVEEDVMAETVAGAGQEMTGGGGSQPVDGAGAMAAAPVPQSPPRAGELEAEERMLRPIISVRPNRNLSAVSAVNVASLVQLAVKRPSATATAANAATAAATATAAAAAAAEEDAAVPVPLLAGGYTGGVAAPSSTPERGAAGGWAEDVAAGLGLREEEPGQGNGDASAGPGMAGAAAAPAEATVAAAAALPHAAAGPVEAGTGDGTATTELGAGDGDRGAPGAGGDATAGGGGGGPVEVGLYAEVKAFQRQQRKARRLNGEAPSTRPVPEIREPPACRFWRLGRCAKGAGCPFRHVGQPATRLLPCRYWRLGRCSYGDACIYSHDPRTAEPCMQLLETGTCANGPACPLGHYPPQDADALRELFEDAATRAAVQVQARPAGARATAAPAEQQSAGAVTAALQAGGGAGWGVGGSVAWAMAAGDNGDPGSLRPMQPVLQRAFNAGDEDF
ncbi:hypothetical protein GPECTOR_62g878 [Gonium pectorale]|uniref:C3H1-type domain-containing protein n=1 Tax=Gonium pectorale TaxID=33097 RepID=A0A150G4Q9_GONPE|nr:hypothetical protein GPECTOR_62g878 [Gonium pectorale]|eukprot:KXZ44763.1 hypothetical protein GPECTOR_62g878 [Gonium pectorale]